jgi:transcriptional regulator with XRE-family HTH domain
MAANATDDREPARVFALGPRIRRARETGRLSLADVAARTDLTKGFLSRVERDAASPSVQSLMRICGALGLDPADLFRRPPTTVVRAAARPQLAGLPGASVIDTLLTPPSERHLTVLESVVAPGGNGGEALYSLRSETEVCFVLEGEIDLVVEGETIRVATGDSVTFGAGVPHTWSNPSTTAGARILWILAPALPDPQSAE